MRSLRCAVAALVLGLVACGQPAAGPAWPKSAGTVAVTDPAEDGGESLAPRATAEAAAALEDAPDRALTELLDEPAAPSADAAPADKPPTTDAPVVPTGTVETIEIEIQDITLEPGDLVTP